MNVRQWNHWEKLRKNGKFIYVLLNGGLVGGLILAVLMTFLHHLIEPANYWGLRLLIYVLIFSPVGILAAIYVWNKNETKFLSENPPTPRRLRSPRHRMSNH